MFLAGMPELLFRAKFAHQMTNASILGDLHSLNALIEEQKFFNENKEKSGANAENYQKNELLSDQDFIINSSLHFNSLSFRNSYLLALLRELSCSFENLVLISDPLTTFYLKQFLKEERDFESLKDMHEILEYSPIISNF